ncbi:MAG: CPBP family intramembrane metalloprotease [Bacilli bacterium]|nr:CPBP family intramembrane metalloprotease [Bacilli bacterium]
MLFGKKNCTQCGSKYDVVEPTCPTCKCRDANFEQLGIPKNILWLPTWKQLVCFAIGLIGLNLISIIGSIFFGWYGQEHYITYVTAVNAVRYGLCAIGIACVLIHDYHKFPPFLKKWYPWVIGIGFAVALVTSSMMYNIIVNLFHPTTANENQQIVNQVIGSFPFTSILLLAILGPIVEEFTYRVGLYSFFRRINKYIAYALTIVIFALIHFDFFAKGDDMINELLNLPSYMISGFLLTLAYEKFGIACSVTAHIGNNLYGVLMTILLNIINKYVGQ